MAKQKLNKMKTNNVFRTDTQVAFHIGVFKIINGNLGGHSTSLSQNRSSSKNLGAYNCVNGHPEQ